MNYLSNFLNTMPSLWTQSSHARKSPTHSGPTVSSILQACAGGALLLLNPAAAASSMASSTKGLLMPRRALLQCTQTAGAHSATLVTPTDISQEALDILTDTTWWMQNDCGEASGEALELTYTTDETFTEGLSSSSVADEFALGSSDSQLVTNALNGLLASNVRVSFTQQSSSSSNLQIQSGVPTPGETSAWFVDAPGNFGGTVSHITFMGTGFDANRPLLLQALGYTLGLQLPPKAGITGASLGTSGGPFSAEALSTSMMAAPNPCYSVTSWGALDLEALGASLGTSYTSDITVTLDPPSGTAGPYVGGLYMPGTNNALKIGAGYQTIYATLDNSGNIVTKLDNSVYLLSPISHVETLTIAGNTSATVVGSVGADTITTGAGNDVIDGNGGADVITTGLGNDVVIVNGDAGVPLVTDFNVTSDALGLTFAVDNVASISSEPFSNSAYSGLQLTFPNGKQVQLAGVASNVALANFIASDVGFGMAASCYPGQSFTNGLVWRGGTNPAERPSPAVTPNSPPPPPSPTGAPPSPPPGPSSHSSVPIGPIIGGVAGVGAIIAGVLVYRAWRRRRVPAPTVPTTQITELPASAAPAPASRPSPARRPPLPPRPPRVAPAPLAPAAAEDSSLTVAPRVHSTAGSSRADSVLDYFPESEDLELYLPPPPEPATSGAGALADRLGHLEREGHMGDDLL